MARKVKGAAEAEGLDLLMGAEAIGAFLFPNLPKATATRRVQWLRTLGLKPEAERPAPAAPFFMWCGRLCARPSTLRHFVEQLERAAMASDTEAA